MMHAPLPHNEKKRLQALRDLVLLDTPPEERFDRISAFAASEFDVPMALVSFVDQDRQWSKSNFGLETESRETPRAISFCGHAVAQSTPLVVPDALADPRFADNPWSSAIRLCASTRARACVCPTGRWWARFAFWTAVRAALTDWTWPSSAGCAIWWSRRSSAGRRPLHEHAQTGETTACPAH